MRALSVALDMTWQEAFLKLATAAYGMCDMPSSNSVIWAVLRQNGFEAFNIPGNMIGHFTVRGFCEANPTGTYVMFTSGHVVAAKDGTFFDSWDSGSETVLFVWYRRDE